MSSLHKHQTCYQTNNLALFQFTGCFQWNSSLSPFQWQLSPDTAENWNRWTYFSWSLIKYVNVSLPMATTNFCSNLDYKITISMSLITWQSNDEHHINHKCFCSSFDSKIAMSLFKKFQQTDTIKEATYLLWTFGHHNILVQTLYATDKGYNTWVQLLNIWQKL